jgi:hypothetical protein
MNLKKIAALTAATSGLMVAGAGAAMADSSATASGVASNSPGVASGNNVQAPVNAPVNVTGNAIDVIGVLDSVFGSHSSN